jgi:hypothetical protein
MDNSEVELDCVNKLKLKCAIHEMNENYMVRFFLNLYFLVLIHNGHKT